MGEENLPRRRRRIFQHYLKNDQKLNKKRVSSSESKEQH